LFFQWKALDFMPKHSETRFLPYTPEQLYRLVLDIERYPEFLPWCVAARITERHEDRLKADMIVGYKAIREKFTSIVLAKPNRRIDVSYVSGPLAQLSNRWIFTPVAGGCELSFSLELSFKAPLLANLFEAFFEKALLRMSAAFEARAHKLYSGEGG
jgi:coenzyme Q-binding protein COQ10